MCACANAYWKITRRSTSFSGRRKNSPPKRYQQVIAKISQKSPLICACACGIQTAGHVMASWGLKGHRRTSELLMRQNNNITVRSQPLMFKGDHTHRSFFLRSLDQLNQDLRFALLQPKLKTFTVHRWKLTKKWTVGSAWFCSLFQLFYSSFYTSEKKRCMGPL